MAYKTLKIILMLKGILNYSVDLIDRLSAAHILRASLRGGCLLRWGLPQGFALKGSYDSYIIYYLDTIDIT